jgi:hypothetical protein
VTTRVNPETGVIEEQSALGLWSERPNENGVSERINPETGRLEERSTLGAWSDKANSSGRSERVDRSTGVIQETNDVGVWRARLNHAGNAERVGLDSGQWEESNSLGGWSAKRNARGFATRTNPRTGVLEESDSLGNFKPARRAAPQAYGIPGVIPAGVARERELPGPERVSEGLGSSRDGSGGGGGGGGGATVASGGASGLLGTICIVAFFLYVRGENEARRIDPPPLPRYSSSPVTAEAMPAERVPRAFPWAGRWRSKSGTSLTISESALGVRAGTTAYVLRRSALRPDGKPEEATFGIASRTASVEDFSEHFEQAVRAVADHAQDYEVSDPEKSRAMLEAVSSGARDVLWSYSGGDCGWTEYLLDGSQLLAMSECKYGVWIDLFERVPAD